MGYYDSIYDYREDYSAAPVDCSFREGRSCELDDYYDDEGNMLRLGRCTCYDADDPEECCPRLRQYMERLKERGELNGYLKERGLEEYGEEEEVDAQ